MLIDFTGRTALITGSTQGIGLATARGLLDAGADVIINGRSQTSLQAALDTLPTTSSRVSGVVADVSTEAGCQAVLEAHPHVDVLVNNVGAYGPQDYFETTDEVWQSYFQTNVMSGVRLARAYAPGMVERQWGRVVYVSSESAVNIPTDMIHYGVTKTAQLALSRGLAKRLAGSGVTVNAVLAGPTLSEGVAQMLLPDGVQLYSALEEAAASFVATQRSSSIIGRAASVEEVANMIIYVCSEQAAATTGAALRVDGGVIEHIL